MSFRKEVTMQVSTGTINEDLIYEALKDKKIKDLSNNMRDMIVHLFGLTHPDDIVRCEKTCDFIKPDIMITLNGVTKGVSIKSANADIVHAEQISTFVERLRRWHISEETIETILLFHYGDGTTDGSGDIRLGYTEIKYQLNDRIKRANDELIKSYDFIVDVLNYCLFDGVREDADKADAIYIGDVHYGHVATKEQIRRYLTAKSWKFYENLHFGPLLIRPHARYSKGKIRYERLRHQIDVYWPRLYHEIEYISRRYNYYDTPYKSWREKHGRQ